MSMISTLILREPLYGWGANDYGQVGDGTTTNTGTAGPRKVASFQPTGIRAIAAGQYHNLVLAEDGGVWVWGANNIGQLGNGDKTSATKTTPVNAADPTVAGENLTGVKAIAAGDGWHSAAVLNDGTVLTWGDDCWSQLGRCTINVHSWLPVPVLDLTNVQTITLGAKHSLVLLEEGTVWSWGANEHGQLGDCSTHGVQSVTRRKVFYLNSVVDIAAAGWHSLALRNDGTVWAWGYNDCGQLGDGTTTEQHTPTRIGALTNIVAIATSRSHCLALRDDGTVWAWGLNVYGQLGDGTTTSTNDTPNKVPVQVKGLANIKAISASGWHSLACG